MKFNCGGWRYLLLALSFLVSRLPAQDSASFSPSIQGPFLGQSMDDQSAPTAAGYPVDSQFGPDLVSVIPGIVKLASRSSSGVVFGGAVSQGYGWTNRDLATDTTGSITGTVSVAQPFVGVYQSGRREGVLLEYSPTIDLFSRHQWNGNVLQRGGIRGYDDLSRRLRWSFASYTTYGLEYLRQLDSIEIGAYPGWITFLQPSNTVLVASAATGMTWRRKELQEFSFIVSGSYSSVNNGPSYNAVSARVQMTNLFGHESKWYLYGQTDRHSNQPGCNRVGSGGGFDLHVSASTRLALEAGPEYGDGACAVRWGASFDGSVTQRLTSRTVLSVSASRHLIEPYLLQSRWTDVYSGRLQQKTSQNTRVDFGAGYARSSDFPGQAGSHYSSLLLFSELHWLLSDSLTFVGSYRYAKRDLHPAIDTRYSWVVASLVWHPASRGKHR
jgi:hypothetical protein